MDGGVPLYRQVATMRINTNRRNPGAVVRHIVTRLENPDTLPHNGVGVVRRGAADRRRLRLHRPPRRRRSPATVAARDLKAAP